MTISSQFQKIYQKVVQGELSKEEAFKQIQALRKKPVQSIGENNISNNHVATEVNTEGSVSSTSKTSPELKMAITNYIVNKIAPLITNDLSEEMRAGIKDLGFMDLGVDSTNLIKLTQEIEQEAGIDLYPTLFFEYSTIHDLGEHFTQEHPATFMKLLKINIAPNENVDKSDKTATITNTSSNGIPQNKDLFHSTTSKLPEAEDDIAVIGMSGIFAGSPNLEQFWENLKNNTDLIMEVPIDHWDYRPWFDSNMQAENKLYCKWGSFISDVDKFDAQFFNISPVEAEAMDPQLRLLLQILYTATEDAGYAEKIRKSNTGVYVGACFHDYQESIRETNRPIKPHDGTGNASTMLANRPSFYFDLKGPSFVVDTACSSSLVALHLACQALKQKECDMAFVAGVNLILNSWHYRYFCSIGTLSPTGKCHTFDQAADGYVPGEGIAALLLKPLKQALKDNDQIHAVIKGSAINHGGYTPSVTAPSVNQETQVILKAWDDAKIDPHTISYIEAHGTGTKLGDPIEFKALQKAFAERGVTEKEVCMIGSAKAHIGHTEGTAGIAGIIKTILSMKHKQIPCMPKFKKLNPFIEIEKGPLCINTSLVDWQSKNNVPTRAGVNSFGFGGAYAHVVLEEAPARAYPQVANKPSYMITLSAKTDMLLKKRIEDLTTWLSKHGSTVSLEEISYSLNTGRSHFEKRCALVVGTVAELEDSLEKFKHHEILSNVFISPDKKNKLENQAIFRKLFRQIMSEMGSAKQLSERDYRDNILALANFYVQGYDLDWEEMHVGESKKRISLPTYPFAKERYWISQDEISIGMNKVETNSAYTVLHPLLDANVSTLETQSFSKILTGKEFFLKDHCVQNIPVLPGVAYLEMARAAATLAMPTQNVMSLKNLIFVQPIRILDQPKNVMISLYPGDNNVTFEITTKNKNKTETNLHAQGKVLYTSIESVTLHTPLAIATIKERCKTKLTREEIYAHYDAIGLNYGPSFQVIKIIWSNANEVLSQIELPSNLANASSKEFLLHPSLMDGALQSIYGLMDQYNSEKETIYLPFSIDEIVINGTLPQKCYVYITSTRSHEGEGLQKFQLQVTDEDGKTKVFIKDFTLRALKTEKVTSDIYYFQPIWKEEPLKEEHSIELCGSILVFDDDGHLLQSLREKLPEKNVIGVKGYVKYQKSNKNNYLINKQHYEDYIKLIDDIKSKDSMPNFIIYKNKSILKSQWQENYQSQFYLTKALIKQKLSEVVKFIYLNETAKDEGDASSLFTEAVSGFAKTVNLEYPKIAYRVIEIASLDEQCITSLLKELSETEKEVCYKKDNTRWIKSYRELSERSELKNGLLKKGGVYLITGGGGGLGLIFARYFAKHYQAKLFLMGRSELKEQQKNVIGELEKLASEIVYIKADVTQLKDVKKVMQQIKKRFGKLNGIIHSAGVVRDAFILKKTQKESYEVLAPKIEGVCNLDEVTQSEPLDFFIMFSSVASIFGNVGQCDYAYANGFMDAFAKSREIKRQQNERQGNTISINWPLWVEGGMTIESTLVERIEKEWGLRPISSAEGEHALLYSLMQKPTQLLVIKGDKKKIRSTLGITKESKTLIPMVDESTEVNSPSSLSLDSLEDELINIVAKVLGLKCDQIDTSSPLTEYGLDSIMMISLLDQAEKNYNITLSSSALIDYPSIHEFAKYLLVNGANKAISVKTTSTLAESSILPLASISPIGKSLRESRKKISNKTLKIVDRESSTKIAVIGMAGRFPGSPNIEAYWENLVKGKELITEIPNARWSILNYFSSDKKSENKSYAKWGGFIKNIELFAADYFGISKEDAIMMDPPQRLLLELTQELIDRSGYHVKELNGKKVGIFIGGGASDYLHVYEKYIRNEWRTHSIVNSIQNMMAARIADFYNFHGPAYTIDTACSSALVALHQACQSILSGESDMGIAGGAEILIGPEVFINFSKASVLSDDGKSYVFDERAKGFVLGEGLGLVFLKKYEKAIEDGDQILAVILGSAINNDGRTPGITVPNPQGQKSVIEEAIRKSNITPDTINYYEAHGTGTLLGDPIEIKAMTEVYQQYTNKKNYCAVGSVKSNIGHILRAAGIASLIKVILAIQHQTIPPTLNCEQPHPRFNFDSSPFYPVTKPTPWEEIQGVRRAAISSFGFGGTNCHLIIGEENHTTQNTQVIRQPLKLTPMIRKRYWLGDATITEDLKTEKEVYTFYIELLQKLRDKKINTKQALDITELNDNLGA